MTAEVHAKIGVLEAALAQAEIAQEEDARKKANIAEEQAKNKEVQAISVQGEIEKLTTELSEMHEDNVFHGHVREWSDLNPKHKNILINEFNFNPNGKPPKNRGI